jgi:UDP-GlcNAc:undecaprenyl-phosphate GlcNAc-1-phosphate transferase
MNELLIIGLAFLISYVFSKTICAFGKQLKILDDPRLHIHPKVVHKSVVPRGGGTPIAIAVITLLALFAGLTPQTAGIITGVLILAITGFIDDRFEEKFSPYARLILNVVAAGLVMLTGISIRYVTSPFGGVINLDFWLASILTVIWLVWMQNIVGWSSGVDGQLPGFVIIAALTMAVLGVRYGENQNQNLMVILALVTAGAYAGFLPWNWYPQKMLPGYGGKSLAGYLLGLLAILSSAKVGVMLLVLGIPVLDAIRVIIKRVSEGRSPVWGGREHFHHYLLDLGWGKRRIAVFYWAVSGILAILALNLNSGAKYFTMAGGTLLFFGLFAWWNYWSISQKPQDRDSGLKT